MLMCECQEPFLRPSSASFLSSTSSPSSSSWPSAPCPGSEKCGGAIAIKVPTRFRQTQYRERVKAKVGAFNKGKALIFVVAFSKYCVQLNFLQCANMKSMQTESRVGGEVVHSAHSGTECGQNMGPEARTAPNRNVLMCSVEGKEVWDNMTRIF